MKHVDKPADQSVLLGDRNRGSEVMVGQPSADAESAAAAGVRRDRARRRRRWSRF
jgi:hypothetical protein